MSNCDPLATIVSEDTRELLRTLERLPLERALHERIQTLRTDIDEALETSRQQQHHWD
jgi:hypothetical protein